MVRKTKEEALETRHTILDAAEAVFYRKGMARTTLADIAEAASVTRGAIYWHFANKGEVFEAMMRRAIDPLEAISEADYSTSERPLEELRERVLGVIERINSDPRYIRVFAIAMHKSEYVDEMVPVVDQCMECCDRHLLRQEQAFTVAKARGDLPASVDPHRAALSLSVMIDGLIASWSLQPEVYSLDLAGGLINCFFYGLKHDACH
ncbi:TetR family transcriptional regulator [Denitromonas halophila]|nr:TetR family transcriptional regulator [Denitromonas halophila]